MKNGTLMILGPDVNFEGRKVFDLKITDAFPILSTDALTTRLVVNGQPAALDDYQHFSIPPDLNIHLTKSSGTNRHTHFLTDLVDMQTGKLKTSFARLFTWCSLPIGNYRKPIGKWHGAQLICLPKDQLFTELTGIFADFFVHDSSDESLQKLSTFPLLSRDMRLLGDRPGNTSGPYKFSEIVRGTHRVIPSYLFSVRFGYYEAGQGRSILDVPFPMK